jgi:mRNA interferase MazF
MIAEGQIVLFKFPQTDQAAGKLRPALVIRKLPGQYNDWLVCMVSSRLDQAVPNFDETVSLSDSDFEASGLKVPSVIRICRLAVVESAILVGALGRLSDERLSRIRHALSAWIQSR